MSGPAAEDLPSDFDYSVLFSDAPVPYSDGIPSEIPSDVFRDESESELLLPTPKPFAPPDSYSDDFDAFHQVQEERQQELNRLGVVIQHRRQDEKPLSVFRSSSLPPGMYCISGGGTR